MSRRGALGAALAALALAGCEASPPSSPATGVGPALSVVASFYPLWEFTRQVAGDRATVTVLVPPGVEPHDWEPAPQDVARLERAQVFVYNGAGFEPWVDKLLGNLSGKGPMVAVATQGIDLLPADLPGHDHGQRAKGRAAAGVVSARQDPHAWLDPVLAQQQVNTIGAVLAQADPENAEQYRANAAAFRARLATLDERFRQGLGDCTRREIVAAHASFGYLAKRYRLTQMPVMGLSPESEPSPAQLAQIVRFARRHTVRYIFFETLVSPKLAETLAREVGARTLVLNPLEGLTGDEEAAGKGYVAIMGDNLTNLRAALDCR